MNAHFKVINTEVTSTGEVKLTLRAWRNGSPARVTKAMRDGIRAGWSVRLERGKKADKLHVITDYAAYAVVGAHRGRLVRLLGISAAAA